MAWRNAATVGALVGLICGLGVVVGGAPAVAAVTPALTTTASPAVTIGGAVSATAVLSGGVSPTGTITFSLYGPNDPTCGGMPRTSTVSTVSGNGSYASVPFTPTATGTYAFAAIYSGDVSNTAVSDLCGPAGQSVVVAQASPGLSVTIPPALVLGGAFTATATVDRGLMPTGTIDFHLYGPSSSACTGLPFAMSSVSETTGDGTYVSAPFTPTATGTYQILAIYEGDANNAQITQPCGGPNQATQVVQALALTNAASAGVGLGGTVTDAATLSGGASPTGTLTFTLFGPDDPTCSRPAVRPLADPVNGDGSYASGAVTPTAAGTYQWTVAYSGDGANAPASTGCGAPGASVSVGLALPQVSLSVSGGGPVGTGVSATARLTGGLQPSGSVVFSLYGPDDPTCAGPAVTTAGAVSGGSASGTFQPGAGGTYHVVAQYAGDMSNGPVRTACAQGGSSVALTKAIPALAASASAPVGVGGPISDAAALAGGAHPTGTLHFLLFGPQDPSCSSPPVAAVTQTVSGNGSFSSGPVTAPAPGSLHWVVTYSGDAGNLGISTACGAAGQTAVVFPGTGGHAGPGYWLLGSDGGIFSYGGATFLGSAAALKLNKPIVAMAATPDFLGYWLVAADGGVFIYGDAASFGSAASVKLNQPIVGMAATPDRRGYWLVASDGGIFAYGDARFYGSPASMHLNSPVIGMAATADGGGYWLVAGDGGIFAYGDAAFAGSPASVRGARVTVGMAPTPDGKGYWVVGADGGVFAYGDARFCGSTGSLRLNSPIVGVAASPTAQGYWLGAADGGVFAYGAAGFSGSAGGMHLNARVIGVAAG